MFLLFSSGLSIKDNPKHTLSQNIDFLREEPFLPPKGTGNAYFVRKDPFWLPTVVSGRSVSHQCVGFYQYTETLGYGDGQLPRVCRCVKKKNEKG